MYIAASLLLFIASAIICHLIATRRGANPVFWGVMGGVSGPLAIPFVLFCKPNN